MVESGRAAWETHGTRILVGLILAVLLASGGLLLSLNNKVALLEQRVCYLNESISSTTRGELALRDADRQALRERVLELEGRVKAIEGRR